jgi:hypothetical protein
LSAGSFASTSGGTMVPDMVVVISHAPGFASNASAVAWEVGRNIARAIVAAGVVRFIVILRVVPPDWPGICEYRANAVGRRATRPR